MSPRVTDEDLADYASRKTYPHTPGEVMAFMAQELIAARRVVEACRAEKADEDCYDNPFFCDGPLVDALDAYDAATAGSMEGK